MFFVTLLTILDSQFCKKTVAGQWARFSGQVSDLITNPLFVGLVLLLGTVLLVWRLPARHQRRLLVSSLVLLVGYGLASTSAAIALGNKILLWFTPADPGGAAEAIVVLGRGSQQLPPRVEETVQLWQARRAPLIFLSGAWDAPRMAEELAERGVPAGVMEGEACSRTTEENAQFTAALLLPRGIRRIVLVTDAPHMLRSLLTFRSVGFDVIARSHALPHYLSRTRRGWIVYREYFGLLTYSLRGRFAPRSPRPPEEVFRMTMQPDQV